MASPMWVSRVEGFMLATGAPGAKLMSLAPESMMAVVEIGAALTRGGGKGAVRQL